MSQERYSAAATMLTESGEYLLLRRLPRVHAYHPPDGEECKHALFVDVETTGLDPRSDRIIQFSGVPFEFSATSGKIFRVFPALECYEDPGRPLSSVIVRKTRITDAMVTGKKLDESRILAAVAKAALIIAHNASFDRCFLERRLRAFAGKHWACSQTDVPWPDNGYDSVKLEFLLYKHAKVYYEPHRADDDCYAGIHLLATPFEGGGDYPMRLLLESARRTTCRIWAVQAPMSTKDILRARGYRWNAGDDGRPRAWWKEVAESQREAELAWMARYIYEGVLAVPRVERIDARRRFSDRA